MRSSENVFFRSPGPLDLWDPIVPEGHKHRVTTPESPRKISRTPRRTPGETPVEPPRDPRGTTFFSLLLKKDQKEVC